MTYRPLLTSIRTHNNDGMLFYYCIYQYPSETIFKTSIKILPNKVRPSF